MRGDIAVFVAIMVPLCALLSVVALPLTRVLFERGAFSRDASGLTAWCLRAYAGSALFHGLVLLFLRVAMADRWLRVPVIGAAVGIVVNLVLDLVLVRFLGGPGIGLAFTLANAANAAVTGTLLLRRLPGSTPSAGLLVGVIAAAALAAATALRSPFPSPRRSPISRCAAALRLWSSPCSTISSASSALRFVVERARPRPGGVLVTLMILAASK